MRNIVVSDYQDSWPGEFDSEKKKIGKVLGSVSVAIHHIGSTSVPGLAAKPVIDILVEVDDLDELDSYNEPLEKIGYLAKGENGISGRRYFEKGGEDRSHQIHAFLRGGKNARRHLAFRDYLRRCPEVAGKYAELKKVVAQKCNNDIEQYCDGKHDFVQHYEKKAVEWDALEQPDHSDNLSATGV